MVFFGYQQLSAELCLVQIVIIFCKYLNTKLVCI